MSIKDIMESMDYGSAPEAATEAMAWLAARGGKLGHFIDGAFCAAEQAATPVENPATGALLGHIPQAGAPEIDAAVAAAKAALASWSRLPGFERARYLYAIARGLQKRERFFALLESLDTGMTMREARLVDLAQTVRQFYHHAGWASASASDFPGHEPLGVCAQIISADIPLLTLASKIAPALAAGNTVVLKPADLTPLGAAAFAELLCEAGLPKGVVNILHGGAETGALLVKHPDVAMVAFSGSTATGREIRRATAGSGKRLTLALGGKSPVIVCADADLDAAVEGVVEGLWLNQGATSYAGSRLILQEGIAPRFLSKLRARMQQLRIGDPLEKNIDMGAIVSAGRKSRIAALIETARAEGYQLEHSTAPLPEAGHFVSPGFFSDSEPACSLWQAEIFGPIALTTSFRTIDEAVALANNSAYGLAASIWSENVNAATELAARVKAGVVWINAASLLDAAAPFGGVKESGYGRDGGRAGLSDYLRPSSAKPAKATLTAPAGMPVAGADLAGHSATAALGDDLVDRTIKNYIGGSFVRPESGAMFTLRGGRGEALGLAPLSGRKDIRNAAEAALKPVSWAGNAHARAQVLYFLGENLAAREAELVAALTESGMSQVDAEVELRKSVERVFYYAGMADKVEGGTHATKSRHLTLSIRAPLGVVGVVAPPRAPILGLLSLILPLIAVGNSVVAVPSAAHARVIAPLMQILATSDLPLGVVNLVIGDPQVLAQTMAEHDAIDALCYHGEPSGLEAVERLSAGNLKPVWGGDALVADWADDAVAAGPDWLARATQLKTIWLPYGA